MARVLLGPSWVWHDDGSSGRDTGRSIRRDGQLTRCRIQALLQGQELDAAAKGIAKLAAAMGHAEPTKAQKQLTEVGL